MGRLRIQERMPVCKFATEASLPANVMPVILFAAFLHASWNAVVKSSPDKFLDIVLVTTGAAALSGFVLLFLPAPLSAAWPYAAGSVVIHVAYFALVGAVYRSGDMSYAYPLMRGVPPLLVALASGPLIGEHLSIGGWSGVLLICGGILCLTLVHGRSPAMIGGPTAFALINAVVIAAYTSVDGVGVRLSGNAAAYTMWVFLLGAPPIVVWAVMQRPANVLDHFRRRWHFALIGGGMHRWGLHAGALGDDSGAGCHGRGAPRNRNPLRDGAFGACTQGAVRLEPTRGHGDHNARCRRVEAGIGAALVAESDRDPRAMAGQVLGCGDAKRPLKTGES